jgi:hypothetical protein
MKNQYFGDRRDYFKYELLERLSADLPDIDRLTCLWMLTAPDRTGQGRVAFSSDPGLPELTRFFRSRLTASDPRKQRVLEMRSYFVNRPFACHSYRANREDFGSDRHEYFAAIPAAWLERAVVFFDPDNGMEPTQVTEKHLRFEEVSDVLARMDPTSVVVIFQFARRLRDFWQTMARQLGHRLCRPVAYIADPTLAFYVVAKDRARLGEIVDVLQGVATRPRSAGASPRTVGYVGGAALDAVFQAQRSQSMVSGVGTAQYHRVWRQRGV